MTLDTFRMNLQLIIIAGMIASPLAVRYFETTTLEEVKKIEVALSNEQTRLKTIQEVRGDAILQIQKDIEGIRTDVKDILISLPVLSELTVRNDPAGSGEFGASRGDRKHKGVDFVVEPGQPIHSPIEGYVSRIAYPYDSAEFKGLEILNDNLNLKVFYLTPLEGIVGQNVSAGDVIGYAQDITRKYPTQGMTPHIHVGITKRQPQKGTEENT
jgi:murein DD-endopeptidase MepM/ murein hydrolase activator NlpD